MLWKAIAHVFAWGLAMFASAAGAETVDQQQPSFNIYGNPLALGGSSEQKLAQVVTAGMDGHLVEVRLPVICSSSSESVRFEIQAVTADKPNGTVITRQDILASDLPVFSSPPEFRGIRFSSPAQLAAGQSFAIVMSTAAECSVIPGPAGNPYVGGDSWFDSRPNPPGWVRDCEFGPSYPCDLPFQTVMRRLISIDIDVRPWGDLSIVEPRSNGHLLVAILGTPAFDPLTVDPATVKFGASGTEAPAVHVMANDVNRDDIVDLVLSFPQGLTRLACGDVSVTLTGDTWDGAGVEGTAAVRTVGCGEISAEH
jgi:hypothetical protein